MSGLKVMSLNTWGMPYSLGSYDKELRMAAIGQYINQSEHDIYLLQVYNQRQMLSLPCINIYTISTQYLHNIYTISNI